MGERCKMQFRAGFFGATQKRKSMEMRPLMGWMVLEEEQREREREKEETK